MRSRKSAPTVHSDGIQAIPVVGIGEVHAGDSIADLILDALTSQAAEKPASAMVSYQATTSPAAEKVASTTKMRQGTTPEAAKKLASATVSYQGTTSVVPKSLYFFPAARTLVRAAHAKRASSANPTAGLRLLPGDILVVKHKIVAKAEGRTVELATVKPSLAARRFAAANAADARVIELALREAKRVVRRKHVLITETQHGFVCANSGVDVSNVDGGRTAVLLPLDPDRSAAKIMRRLKKRTSLHLPVVIADSFGRAWREGLHEVAIGLAGISPIHDYRGQRDSYGYTLHSSDECVADELACLAGLVCGKNNGVPACIIRGYRYRRGKGSARQIIRPVARDLFR